MLKLLAILGTPAVAALVLACGGDDRPRRTGIAEVDAVIEAVESGDAADLRALLRFRRLPCDPEAGAGGPACADGETAGTEVEVFEVLDCEPRWLRRGSTTELLDQVSALQPETYAAFVAPASFYLPGEYAVIFGGDDPRADEAGLQRYVAAGVGGEDGRLTGMALGCGIDEPVHFLLPHDPPEYLIEPRD